MALTPASASSQPVTDTVVTDTPQVACDGGDGALGHPRVFLTVEPGQPTVCPYCSRAFVLAEGARSGHGH